MRTFRLFRGLFVWYFLWYEYDIHVDHNLLLYVNTNSNNFFLLFALKNKLNSNKNFKLVGFKEKLINLCVLQYEIKF
jgi:hypothetical protein